MSKQQAEQIIRNEDGYTWMQLKEARRVNPEAAAEVDAEVEALIRQYSIAGRNQA